MTVTSIDVVALLRAIGSEASTFVVRVCFDIVVVCLSVIIFVVLFITVFFVESVHLPDPARIIFSTLLVLIVFIICVVVALFAIVLFSNIAVAFVSMLYMVTVPMVLTASVVLILHCRCCQACRKE